MYKSVIIINNESLGYGDSGVGNTLLGVFLRKVVANPVKPDAIVFYNSGVRVLAKNSPFLDMLEALEYYGVELIACGTCVYKICGQSSLTAGRISNMEEIAQILLQAQKVITL
ncbi:MAG: hypothetical protein ATN34_03515 [Epulopiscium sp. Nele67-Bin002]|nr:MAG: hypothetical protein BEN18_05775 [Epulopiscium sp. Nuni2H_MBin001]OON92219.1 MAG: hypothetical protein ATN34_03515 [Epulopiscium sp. Nele67-Bin002]OON93930.1 MAG: hypothetical protein ATN33_05070 [Epulopiscium sp. Nele67-Bin001]